MTYFFFGTLMDRDVLATVLDRPVATDEMIPAWLHDHQRMRAATVSYPVLVRSPGLRRTRPERGRHYGLPTVA